MLRVNLISVQFIVLICGFFFLQSHILAAKAVANILRTSLGPKGKLYVTNSIDFDLGV